VASAFTIWSSRNVQSSALPTTPRAVIVRHLLSTLLAPRLEVLQAQGSVLQGGGFCGLLAALCYLRHMKRSETITRHTHSFDIMAVEAIVSYP